MDTKEQTIISNIYTKKEGFKSVYPWFKNLKKQGLMPHYIVMDGERSVMRAIDMIWPKTTIQRCLYHIQREGMRWLRTYPRQLQEENYGLFYVPCVTSNLSMSAINLLITIKPG
jgi:hypothetical protein